MLNYILFELTDTVAMNSCNEHIIKITNYIEANLTQKLTLEDVSKAANLTKEYTAYLFKKETGKTVTSYINERKMLLAKELIDNGKMTLSDVALHLSFENYNYFSRLFKKNTGMTPLEYRESHR
jgi:two-component system response regulator YesN